MLGLTTPLLLLGLGALAVPVLLHLARREEPRAQPFPSLMFLRRLPVEPRRRRRLRDPWLLALRGAALGLLVLAFAGPVLAPGSGQGPDRQRDLAIVLDRSYSMARAGAWPSALAEVRARIDGLGRGDRAALVLLDDRAVVVQPLTGQRELLLAALDRAEPGERGTRYAAGFSAASELLAEGGARMRALALISDLQHGGLAGGARLAADVTLEVVAVRAPLPANAALLRAVLAAGPDGAARLRIGVRNTGAEALAAARIRLTVDGRDGLETTLAIEPGEERSVELPVVLALDRTTPVELTLGPDALAADNRYLAVLAPPRVLRVGLISSAADDAGGDTVDASGPFLEEALRLADDPPITLEQAPAGGLSGWPVAPLDVLIVDDVPLASGYARRVLAETLGRGGGVLVLAGHRLGEIAPGPGLALPAGIGGVVRPERAARLDGAPLDHPFWRTAGLDAEAFAGLQVRAYHTLHPEPGSTRLARLEGGAALLVQAAERAPRMLILATTTAGSWSTLGSSPGFLPLLHGALRYLGGRASPALQYPSGTVVDLARHASADPNAIRWQRLLAAGGALLEPPGGGMRRLAAGQTLVQLDEPGLYEVNDPDGGAPPLRLAVNADRRESLPDWLEPAAFEQALMRSRPGPAAAAGEGDRGAGAPAPDAAAAPSRLAWALLLIAAALLLIEARLANRAAALAAEPAAGRHGRSGRHG